MFNVITQFPRGECERNFQHKRPTHTYTYNINVKLCDRCMLWDHSSLTHTHIHNEIKGDDHDDHNSKMSIQ